MDYRIPLSLSPFPLLLSLSSSSISSLPNDNLHGQYIHYNLIALTKSDRLLTRCVLFSYLLSNSHSASILPLLLLSYPLLSYLGTSIVVSIHLSVHLPLHPHQNLTRLYSRLRIPNHHLTLQTSFGDLLVLDRYQTLASLLDYKSSLYHLYLLLYRYPLPLLLHLTTTIQLLPHVPKLSLLHFPLSLQTHNQL